MATANVGNEMSAVIAQKCAHPVCSCPAGSGKYCSVECEAMEKVPDIDCRCNHSGCQGHTN
jgi:hypothetical protein